MSEKQEQTVKELFQRSYVKEPPKPPPAHVPGEPDWTPAERNFIIAIGSPFFWWLLLFIVCVVWFMVWGLESLGHG